MNTNIERNGEKRERKMEIQSKTDEATQQGVDAKVRDVWIGTNKKTKI